MDEFFFSFHFNYLVWIDYLDIIIFYFIHKFQLSAICYYKLDYKGLVGGLLLVMCLSHTKQKWKKIDGVEKGHVKFPRSDSLL